MYLLTADKHSCTGCGACQNICPQKCIQMLPDEDGFYFPSIDKTSCVGCHKCEKICPVEHAPEKTDGFDDLEIIAAKVKSEDLLLASSSGGAFTQIVNGFMAQDECYIWGAAFDTRLQVRHICSFRDEQLGKMRGSKYVQSNMGDCYHTIKEQLKQGKKVLFSGTPCQVAGLRNFLQNSNTENLFCVDLLCHGVPSQKIFDCYIEEESKRYRSRIKGARFRYKIENAREKWTTRNIELTTENGKRHVQTRFRCNYLRAYHPSLMNRESCYNCVFSLPVRYGDLTIGDFWSIQKYYPQLSVEHGVSLIQSNTNKGRDILEFLKKSMDWYPIDREEFAKKSRGPLVVVASRKMNPKRTRFLEIQRKQGLKKALDGVYPFHSDGIRFCVGKAKGAVKKLFIK